jgi:hypothetical protein
MMKYIWPLVLVLSFGCSKEEFTSAPRTESIIANPVEVFQNLTCANSSTIKPPVDILYVVDNSLSAGYINATVKDQIRQTIQSISQEFDYRVMVAPLLDDGLSDTFRPVITNNAASLSGSINVVPLEGLPFFGQPIGGNNEQGFKRTHDLIELNKTGLGKTGIFRNQAHTLIVLVSNGDDRETINCPFGGQCTTNNAKINEAVQRFSNLKNSLEAKQLRFFTLVAHSACQSGWVAGERYKIVSQRVANESNSPAINSTDSYDLCANNYNIYAGVNQSIREIVVPHTYNRWQISSNPSSNLEVMSVHKLTSSGQTTAVPVAGYSCGGSICYESGFPPNGLSTRIAPTVGENQTGKFIKLQPSAYVTYPDCLVVKTNTPTEYYGYAVLPTQPRPETIVVRVRGSNISENPSNGWTYMGYLENQNIKVNQNGTPNNTNPLNRTGYFIKLNGTAIYASGETLEVFYTPAPI